MNGVSQLNHTEGVTLITFGRIPSDTHFVSDILTMVSDVSINIDMISLTDTQSGYNSLSFTVEDEVFGDILQIAAQIKARYPSVRPLVSSGNSKISLFGEEMRTTPGVAAKAISAVVSVGADVRLITTSEVDISMLVAEPSVTDVMQVLQQTFAL